MKNYFTYILIFAGLISYAQQYQWTGASGDIDFFNELNWKDTSTSEIPPINSINAGEIIEFQLLITCEVYAENEINLGENGKITLTNGELNGDSITGLGNIVLGKDKGQYLIDACENGASNAQIGGSDDFCAKYYKNTACTKNGKAKDCSDTKGVKLLNSSFSNILYSSI